MRLQIDGPVGLTSDAPQGGTRDLQIVTLPDGVFLYASTGAGGGLAGYALTPDASAAPVDALHFADHLAGVVTPHLATVMDGDAAHLIFGGGGAGLVGRALDDTGHLGTLARIDGPQSAPAALAQVTLDDGASALYLAGAADGGIATLTGNGDGGFSAPAGGGADLTGVVALDALTIGGDRFLLAADTDGHGVTSYRIDAGSGALDPVSGMGAADGLGVQAPSAMATATAHGSAWVVLAGAGSDSLSVMRLDAAGALTPTDHVIDTAATHLGAVQALEVVEADGHLFVIAGGGDGGVSLFSLLPDGRLVHLDSLDAGAGTVSALAATVMGDALEIYLGDESAGGLTALSVPLGGLGDVIEGPRGGGARITATGGSDVIVARGDNDTLVGGAGDDILVAGPGRTVLRGGDGADTFVMRAGSGESRVADFEPGIDRLDLSDWAMLRNPDQLDIIPTDDGARITWGDEVLIVISRDGTPLARDDLFGGGFDTPDRILILATDQPLYVPEDNDGDDDEPQGLLIYGDWRDNSLLGGGGADTLHSGAGDNTLRGGDGDDLIYGGDGDNRLWGGAGNDTIYGGDGDDRIGGGPGDAYIEVSGGNNTIYGGVGNNEVHAFGDGDNRIWVGRGDGQVTVYGDGDNRIGGTRGDDVITIQGGGNNTIYGGAGGGDNTIYGGTGNDRIFASPGNGFIDATAGGNNDLYGGLGNDRIIAGSGDDTLTGGQGDDTLTGGNGADTFVFRTSHDHNTITDFDTDDGDILHLMVSAPWADDLWRGTMSAQDVVDQFATVIGGDTVFTFANGDRITLPGFDDLTTLVNHILIDH